MSKTGLSAVLFVVISSFLSPDPSLLSEDEHDTVKVRAVKNNNVLKIIFFMSVAFIIRLYMMQNGPKKLLRKISKQFLKFLAAAKNS